MNGRNGPQSFLGLALLAVLAVLLAGCGRMQAARGAAGDLPDLTITLDAGPGPAANQPSTLLVKLVGAGNQPVDGAQVQLEGDMTHAGMAPVLTAATGEGGGVYRAPLTWTMGGDWVVTVKVVLPDGRTATRSFPVGVSGK